MRWNLGSITIIHRKITWLLLFSVCSLGVASWLIYASRENIERTSQRVHQSHEVIEATQHLIIDLSVPMADSPVVTKPPVAVSLSSATTFLSTESRYARLVPMLDTLEQLAAVNQDQPESLVALRQAVSQQAPPSKLITLLYVIQEKEKTLLEDRKRLHAAVNKRTIYGMMLGRTLAFIFVFVLLIQLNRDISRRKKVQEQLVVAVGDAQAARQLQEQFLANMSHEIRTPMNGIKGMTDLLLDTRLGVRQQELTGMIKSSVDNLLVIVNDILDFSKIKAGKLNIEKIDFQLMDVLDNVRVSFGHRLKKKGLTLHSNIAGDIPPVLTGDPHRLNQVLINLLGNALKFTERGHIDIKVSAEYRLADEVVIHFVVTDTGIGIPAESLPYIFDSFSQAGRDISRRYGGTGLGLSICRQLLHLQGGNISASSVEGKGSSFHFYLPYGFKDRPSTQTAAPEVAGDTSNLLRGRHFLVAEDNEINQKLIDYVLTKAGATVHIAGNGAEAVDILREGQAFDCIIMDLQMPEMDGYTATRCIRKDLRIHTPIIAMTATAMKGEHLQCLESGMNDYMTKPFEFADLYKRLNCLLG